MKEADVKMVGEKILLTTRRLDRKNEVSIVKPIRDVVGIVVYFFRGVNLDI